MTAVALTVTACAGSISSSTQDATGGQDKGRIGAGESVDLDSVGTCTLLTDQQVRAVFVQPVDNQRPLGSVGFVSCAIQAEPVDPADIFGNFREVMIQKPPNGAVAQYAYISKGNRDRGSRRQGLLRVRQI